MWFGVLGPTLVRSGADVVSQQSPKHRALIAALALTPGRSVPIDTLIEAIWGTRAPASATSTLHGYVSLVRRELEPGLAARTPSRFLLRSDLGYELRVDPQDVDAHAFTRTVNEVHASLGPLATDPAPAAGDPEAASRLLGRLDEALALWRGEPYADLAGAELVGPERARLAELRTLALEDRATLLVATGAAAQAVGELEALTVDHPLRERIWALLAVALARVGRQADALAALERLRTVLDEELGIDPGAPVRELQTAILRQEVDHVPAVPAAPAAGPHIPVPDWPLVGREDELATLEVLLAQAAVGVPLFASVVGEPGAGKSRLALELGRRAAAQGAEILLGRSSQEEDAPPLWPWTQALGHELGAGRAGDHDAARFALAEEVRAELAGRSAARTLVVFLEDLHWADESSLRVLRHLANHADRGRLLVVATWRRGTAGSGPLAEVAEALARRHATGLELTGLGRDEARGVLTAIAGDRIDDAGARAAQERTEGNPFFLIEYARLARDRDRPLGEVLGLVPRSVTDVVQRRLRQLPEASFAAVTAGAVIGREFDLGLLAAALEATETDALDLLEPALEIDVLQDLGGDRFRFAHALVRDAAYTELTPSRRERMHARLAGLVEGMAEATPGTRMRASQVARHWAAAGERYVDRAWRAAGQAGRIALGAHAAPESVRHFTTALELIERDPAATTRDRYDLLVGYVEACRWSTRFIEMTRAADEAVAIAAELGEPDLLVAAISVVSGGSPWPWRPYGTVKREVADALRSALDLVPDGDSPTRSRLMMCLARELYYGPSFHENDALVEESLEMARRLGDPALLLEQLQSGYGALWRRGSDRARLALAVEAHELAVGLGDERAAVATRFLVQVTRCALAELDGLDDELARIVADARHHHLYFIEMATVCLQMSWCVLRAQTDEFERGAARLRELDELISVPNKVDAIQGALLGPFSWADGPTLDPEAAEAYLAVANVPVGATIVQTLLRRGLRDAAARLWARVDHGLGVETWYAEVHRSALGEVALELGERALGAEVYGMLAPLGDVCMLSGSAPVFGPMAAYQAFAAAAAGETEVARRHADRALERCEEWGIPVVARRVVELRERYGF